MSLATRSCRIAPSSAQMMLACLLLAIGFQWRAPRAVPLSFLAADTVERAAPLFDMDTEPVIAGAVLDKWHRVKADIDSEFEALKRCHAAGPCPPAAQRP